MLRGAVWNPFDDKMMNCNKNNKIYINTDFIIKK